jgi:hypothetical protein
MRLVVFASILALAAGQGVVDEVEPRVVSLTAANFSRPPGPAADTWFIMF